MKFFSKEKAFIIMLLIISIIFITFFSISTSPLYGTGPDDSCGYILMGMEVADGKVPYLSISDNKGPVLWIIEGIGQLLIRGETGVFITQCIFLFFSLLLITKIVKELFNLSLGKQIICCIVYLIAIAGLYHGGNLTEEFSLFFIILSLYAIARLINKKITYFKLAFILAICITCVIFIRINDCFSIAYMWMLILFTILSNKNDRFINLKKYLFGSICGFLIIFAPIVIYYGINNALYNVIDDYFLVGMGYAKNNLGLGDGIIKRILLLFKTEYGYILVSSFVFTLVALCIKHYINDSKNKVVNALILGINISIITAALIKPAGYKHYLIPISLSYVLIVALLLESYDLLIKKFLKQKKLITVLFLVGIILINIIFIKYSYSMIKDVIEYEIIGQYSKKIDIGYRELAKEIDMKDKDKGISFKSPRWYLTTNTRPIIKYVWTDTLEYNEEKRDIFINSLKENAPKWLFAAEEKDLKMLGDEVYDFIKNNYILKKENFSGKIYFYKGQET